VHGDASVFANDEAAQEGALARACRSALDRSGYAPRQLSLVCAGANGVPTNDGAEARALVALLGRESEHACITAPKSSLGESFDASGVVQAVVALEALRSRVAAPIVGLAEPSVTGLHYAMRATELEPGCALVTSNARSGACSALLLSVQP
jgi:3-oxoacyl-(acyl-carrier-protein) synthase